MLRLFGSQRRLCSGLTRRDWMHVGGLGMLGVSLAEAERLKAFAEGEARPDGVGFGSAKSCILLLPYGSPPQHETFDPKPFAPQEVRGVHQPISTALPGTHFCEGLPKVAGIADRLTVVRSMTHPHPLHCTAYVTSGIPDYTPALETRPRDRKHWPFIGSIVDYVDERRAGAVSDFPRNVAMPWKMNSRGGEAASVQAGPYAAFLGRAYDPVLTDFPHQGTKEIIKQRPYGTKHTVKDPYAGCSPDSRFDMAGVKTEAGISLDRLNTRKSLLQQFGEQRSQLDGHPAIDSYDRHQRLAWSLVSSEKVQRALDVQSEAPQLRERYGMNLFGQSCLLARRMVEAGSRFVTVFWDEYAYLNTDWDTHWNQTHRLNGWLLPGFDSAFSSLILDLEDRGLLDETLVVWMSEHGRTPKFNSNAGRDHWSRVYSLCLAGAGIPRGRVVGSSDDLGGDVQDTPISPKDILATIFHLLGIDPRTHVPDQLNRPMPVAGTGKVRFELL
ncbi:MAG: DUF1501 domain-containing protein [Planctomycetes bacterium]|nr:DUF1501 domain-containing protein [Planctomycetota bacterium]